MALSKLAIGLIASVLTVGAVGGITAGIVTSQNRSEESIIPSDNENDGMSDNNSSSKPEENPSIQPQKINLDKVLEEITASNIVYTPTTKPVTIIEKSLTPAKEATDLKTGVYAFDVKVEELSLDTKTKEKIPANVAITFELANKNNGTLLNVGKLPIVVKASINQQETESKQKSLELEGFKQTSAELKMLFSELKEEQTNKAVLDLSKPIKSNVMVGLSTLEDLNKTSKDPKAKRLNSQPDIQAQEIAKEVNGLTALFQKVKEPMEDAEKYKTVSIQGEVKLEKITKSTKEKNETLFHLVSANNKGIKLVDTKAQSASNEAIVDEIIVKNLLASSIKLIPIGLEDQDQKTLLEEFKKSATSSKGYKGDETKGYSIEVKTDPEGDDPLMVGINPLLIKRTQKDQPITVNLEVSFGTGENKVKTYKTSDDKALKELIDAGFSFEIFSKKLEGETNAVVQAMKIAAEGNKLNSYFIKDGFKTPVKKMDLKMGMNPKGGFSLVPKSNMSLTANIEIGTATSIKPMDPPSPGASDVGQENWLAENWISFVGYSFNGFGTTAINNESLLIIPTINLIHIAEPTAKLPA